MDYIRPGILLVGNLGAAVRDNPGLKAVVMGKHGLVTWGGTARGSYENTLRIIGEAQAYLDARRESQPFGGARVQSVPDLEADALLAGMLPVLRGAMRWGERPVILQVDRSPDVLAFVNSHAAARLSQVGAACPDHLSHTKRVPLFLDWTPEQGAWALTRAVREGVARFQAEYAAYLAAHRREGDVMVSPAPRVVLIPGVRMVTEVPAELLRRIFPS